jgi:hypothetical protein
MIPGRVATATASVVLTMLTASCTMPVHATAGRAASTERATTAAASSSAAAGRTPSPCQASTEAQQAAALSGTLLTDAASLDADVLTSAGALAKNVTDFQSVAKSACELGTSEANVRASMCTISTQEITSSPGAEGNDRAVADASNGDPTEVAGYEAVLTAEWNAYTGANISMQVVFCPSGTLP